MLAAVIEMFAVVLPTQQDRYTVLESVDSHLDHSTCNANCSVELVQHAARRERLNPTSQVVRGASPHQQSKVPKKAESMNCHHIYEELRGTPFQEGQE